MHETSPAGANKALRPGPLLSLELPHGKRGNAFFTIIPQNFSLRPAFILRKRAISRYNGRLQRASRHGKQY
jgi:hypothetical protein